VILDWGATDSQTERRGLAQLGRRIWSGESVLQLAEIWQVPGLQMDIRWQGGVLGIHAVYAWPTRRARLVSAVMPAVQQKLYAALVYYLVYFPVSWWLERECSWTLLHASALASSEGGLVLSGLPGCGKSTTSLAALQSQRWQIVSDNLLYTDGGQVFSCPEPIHVDAGARALIGDVAERAHDTGRRFSHQRQDYELAPQARQDSVKASALGFLHIGEQTQVIAVGQEDAALRLMANDFLAKEWAAYQESAAAMHQVWSCVGDQMLRTRNLTALARSGPCYDIAVGRDTSVANEIEHVTRVMLHEKA